MTALAAEPMSAAEVLMVLADAANVLRSKCECADPVACDDCDISRPLRDSRAAVSAMAEREAALVKEIEALAVRLKALESEVSARRAGWASFVDDEDPSLLVVAHQDRSVHFTGASAWDDANAIDAARAEARK